METLFLEFVTSFGGDELSLFAMLLFMFFGTYKFGILVERFTGFEKQFKHNDKKFEQAEKRFKSIDKTLEDIKKQITRMEVKLDLLYGHYLKKG